MRKKNSKTIFFFILLVLTSAITVSPVLDDYNFVKAYGQDEPQVEQDPSEATEEEAVDEDAEDTASQDTASQDTASQDTASQDTTSTVTPTCNEGEILVDNECTVQSVNETVEDSSSETNETATNTDENLDEDNNNTTESSTMANATEGPDGDCLFNPSLPKCAPIDGQCPDGFNMNEDGQCFPEGGCPDNYHRVDDDETGTCYPNEQGCPEGMIFYPDKRNCGYKEDLCEQYPDLAECQETPSTNQTIISLATIDDSDETEVCEDDSAILDASNSYDPPENEIVSYKWSVVDGVGQDDSPIIDDDNAIRTRIDTNNILNSNSAVYTIELEIKGSDGTTDVDYVTLEVNACPSDTDTDDQTGEEEEENNTESQSTPSEPLQITPDLQTNNITQATIYNLLNRQGNNTNIITASAACDPISETLNLTGTMQPKNLALLALFDECTINNGTALLNLPNDNNLTLAVGNFGNTSSNLVLIDASPQSSSNLEISYNLSLSNEMTGIDPKTQTPKTVSGVNAIGVLNVNTDKAVTFTNSSQINATVNFVKQNGLN